jgi:competence protein ComFB
MIRNLVEDHARDCYATIVRRFPDFCGCDVCREDVLVYALNRVGPRYVTSTKGHAVTDVALEREQDRVVIDVALLEGLRKVGAAPRCGRRVPPG